MSDISDDYDEREALELYERAHAQAIEDGRRKPRRYAMDPPDDADLQHERHVAALEVEDYAQQQELEHQCIDGCAVCGYGTEYI